MAFLPRSLPDLAPAYQSQLQFEPPHVDHHDVLSNRQQYGPHGFYQTIAFSSQTQTLGGQGVAVQHHALQPFTRPTPTLHPRHAQVDAALAGTNQPGSASAATTGPASSMGPPKQRKPKAATLRADDWKPYKERILELHIEHKQPLPEVMRMIEEEFGFKAELRQYRLRISQWGKDKNVKPQEMKAIVRKHQKRKLVEIDKGQLVFKVRDSEVKVQKIERWMKRHDVADSFLYAPSPAASTPSDVECHTIYDGSSPAAPVLSPGGMYPTAQSPHMPSPTLSVSSIVRPQTSAFPGRSPAPAYRSLSNSQLSFAYSPSTSGSAMDVSTQTWYREREVHLRNQIFVAETSFASNSLETSSTLYDLGQVFISQGRYRAAENVARRLVESYESESSSSSDDNAETLKALSLLGQVLLLQGLYVKAERLFRRALQRRRHLLGLQHPDTLLSMQNLAVVSSNQGRLQEAEEIVKETLALRKEVLGSEHPDTLGSMISLAVVLNQQGRLNEAEETIKEALALHKKVLGSEHPETLRSMSNLALVLDEQGRHNEAEEINKEVLALYKKVLGPEHPDTLLAMGYLASILFHQGRYTEAEAIDRETLALRKKVLGPEHPHTLMSIGNLRLMLERQGKFEEV